MGVFDKIKNALFEEEYVEVEEKPKKPKKSKIKEKKEKEEETPIAKKIVLPEKKEKIETLEEEELDSNDYEFRPKDDIDKKELLEKKKDFRIMEDDDFKVDVDEPITDDGEELKIVPVIKEPIVEDNMRDEIEVIGNDNYRMKDDDFPFKDKDDRFNVNDYSSSWNDNYKEKKSYVDDLNNSTEDLKNDYSTNINSNKKLYGIDNSTKITMHEYGTYERKEEKSYFKPSPIISPIYGILDKNYKKEDVVQKREVRLSNSFERDKISIDDIRKKAYGSLTDDLENEFLGNGNENTYEKVQDVADDENLLLDLNDEKPTVKEVTMGDAVEYFEDLGLEYNVDYVDDSKKQVVNEVVEEPVIEEVEPKKKIEVHREKEETPKKKKEDKKEEKKEERVQDVEIVPEREDNKDEELIEDKNEELEKAKDDDNLFDLIDSMYQE